eukprot:CAMPEP_0202381592 /NCGR_PEP_ID=MMETSP1127-20130417/37027_1 /ASSEMBLY_ACC=CAM_ASM_000462 /TAXON_ID=3047 /ORGANISM="Dunaliella tertiolecta, Strain CCMP1320" /LENGTH=1435 /DNA_ID=CAMNT_0048980603 /DNA_START=339 /DNA_END=4646 /DNA_ORIENTATION=+
MTPMAYSRKEGMAMTARGSPGGAGSMGLRSGSGMMRPNSAPRERPSPQALKATLFSDARGRVEELRQMKEAQYWGRELPPKRDLPAYWSVSTHGQPFNDERLFNGATNVYQVINPSGRDKNIPKPVGPATEQQALLRKSLKENQLYLSKQDLSPLPHGSKPHPLGEPERVLVLSKLTPYQRIHALRLCLDRDIRAKDFIPWTQMVWDKLNARFWRRNRDMCIRLATQRLENYMKRHLQYLADQKCNAARAPASRTKDVLREAFWRVDPDRTGRVSLQQFLQVWQNVLCLLEYRDEMVASATGRSRVVLVPGRRILIDLPMCSAIFTQYGFDKDGLMPYVVFINAISASPARLLGQEVVISASAEGRHGLGNDVEVAYCVGNAKIVYPKCAKGVFPPSGFDPRVADRSMMPPNAHMWLEHAYGYAGMDTLATNVFYTKNTTETRDEVVYYVGCVGIVYCKQDMDKGLRSQRFFFGHTNDIKCLAIHPSRQYVVSGQQKATGPDEVPYACVWDVDNCNLLQRLDHDISERAVIACCFSGNINHPDPNKKGGDLLVTITADDRHTIHLWQWMKPADKYCKSVNIPGWFLGPHKKLEYIRAAAARTPSGTFYQNPHVHDEENPKVKDVLKHLSEEEVDSHYRALKDAPHPRHPIIEQVVGEDNMVNEDWEFGYCDNVPRAKKDGTWELLMEYPGCNGTPPMIYGVAWNPLKPQDGRRGSEFVTYGVKHLKTWIVDEEGVWRGTAGSFGTTHIENVLSACYVPALHYMAAPGDSCILTGFSSGQVGLWVPPYPTRANATYKLVRKFEAHGPGKPRTLNNGTQQCKGVRVIKLRADPNHKLPTGRRVLTGGSDGCVLQWELSQVDGTRKDGTPIRGVNMFCMAEDPEEKCGPGRYKLQEELTPYEVLNVPSVTALDCHHLRQREFVAGTDQCDIWEVDKDPRVLVEGHEETVEHVATHPRNPSIFVTGCRSGKVRVWNMDTRQVEREASVGFPVDGCAFANEDYPSKAKRNQKSLHVAFGSVGPYSLGERHKIAVLDVETLQPLKVIPEPVAQVQELVYSPANGPGILAAGCCDMTVYLFNAKHEYHLIAKCIGHSGNVEHIDWSYPISQPGSRLHGQMIIQSSDTSGNLLYWDTKTGKKIAYNQRDAPWSTWTTDIGFSVMGIWPDYSDRTDINATCRSKRGSATYIPPPDPKQATKADFAASVLPAKEEECADAVPECGYLVTGDDFSTVRLFNYPVVWDDAPYKAFRGHASHVMDVRFNCNDTRIVSVGGLDRAIFQWRTAGIALQDAEEDKKLLAAWQHAIKERGAQDSMLEAKPGVEWQQLDKDGKVWGPKAVKEQIDEELEKQASMRQFTRQATRPGSALSISPNRTSDRQASRLIRPNSAGLGPQLSPQHMPSKQLLKTMSTSQHTKSPVALRYGANAESPPPTPGAVRPVRQM